MLAPFSPRHLSARRGSGRRPPTGTWWGHKVSNKHTLCAHLGVKREGEGQKRFCPASSQAFYKAETTRPSSLSVASLAPCLLPATMASLCATTHRHASSYMTQMLELFVDTHACSRVKRRSKLGSAVLGGGRQHESKNSRIHESGVEHERPTCPPSPNQCSAPPILFSFFSFSHFSRSSSSDSPPPKNHTPPPCTHMGREVHAQRS
jgi:hypothetical protein